jgi:Uma2 family endonuclease
MPTEIHQALVRFLYFALFQFVDRHKLGQVYDAGLRVRLREGKIRLPDVLFLHKDHYHLRHNRLWDGADLVMEVVSDNIKDRQRDYEQKLGEYAEGNIAEYWIVDAQNRKIIVHQLHEDHYLVQGEYESGKRADSALLPGFAIDVTQLFATIDEIPA